MWITATFGVIDVHRGLISWVLLGFTIHRNSVEVAEYLITGLRSLGALSCNALELPIGERSMVAQPLAKTRLPARWVAASQMLLPTSVS